MLDWPLHGISSMTSIFAASAVWQGSAQNKQHYSCFQYTYSIKGVSITPTAWQPSTQHQEHGRHVNWINNMAVPPKAYVASRLSRLHHQQGRCQHGIKSIRSVTTKSTGRQVLTPLFHTTPTELKASILHQHPGSCLRYAIGIMGGLPCINKN